MCVDRVYLAPQNSVSVFVLALASKIALNDMTLREACVLHGLVIPVTDKD